MYAALDKVPGMLDPSLLVGSIPYTLIKEGIRFSNIFGPVADGMVEVDRSKRLESAACAKTPSARCLDLLVGGRTVPIVRYWDEVKKVVDSEEVSVTVRRFRTG